MKILICILASLLSSALLGCSQPVPDAPEVQVDAAGAIAPDSLVPDARPAIVPDAAPVAPMDVECVTYPAIEQYDALGRLIHLWNWRYARIANNDLDRAYICPSYYLAQTTTCDSDPVSCQIIPDEFPSLRCLRATPIEDDQGQWFVQCGYRIETDPDGDGVFTVTHDFTDRVEIR